MSDGDVFPFRFGILPAYVITGSLDELVQHDENGLVFDTSEQLGRQIWVRNVDIWGEAREF